MSDIINRNYTISYKHDNDPVTDIDIAIDNFLKNNLSKRYPEFGWLSEETKDDKKRLSSKYVWIVDPIDGTREFIQSIPEFAISIALIKNHEPILAVVFNPMTNELYSAVKGNGAYLNYNRIQCSQKFRDKPVIIVSRSDYQKGKFDYIKEKAVILPIGSSAYKLCRIAKGDANAAITFHPMHEWDIAAGVLIAGEAGIKVVDINRKSISFNESEDTLIDSFVATSPGLENLIFEIIKG